MWRQAAARLNDHTQKHAHGLMAAQMGAMFLSIATLYLYVGTWGFDTQGLFTLRELIQTWLTDITTN